MRLGLQTQRLDHTVPDFCIRAKVGVLKVINAQDPNELRKVKEALPDCVFIYRKHFQHDAQPLDNPKQRAVEVYDAIMPHASQFPYDYIEGYNETGYWDAGPNYNIFTVELSKLLHAAGQKHLAYSFGVGHPVGYATFPYEQDPEKWLAELARHWAVYHAGLAEADALGLHQYKLPGHDDRFTLLRHRLAKQALPSVLRAKPVYLTEFGLDDTGNPGDSGWNGSSWGWTPEQYAAWLVETARKISDEVAGAAVFGCGMYGWESFDVLGYPVIADAIARVNEEKKEMTEVIDIVDELPRSRPPATRDVGRIENIVIHHVGVAGSITPQQVASYHTRPTEEGGKNWPTIAYHYFVAADGTIYKTAQHNEITYHVGEYNPTSLGICLSGRFDSPYPPPTAAQIASLTWLIGSDSGLPDGAIKGHYELRPTVCPGSEWFEEWRRGLADPSLEEIIAELEAENAALRDDMDMMHERTGRWVSG